MNRSEELEYFLLDHGLEIPGRGTSIAQLFQEAQLRYKDCDYPRLLAALYNLNNRSFSRSRICSLDGCRRPNGTSPQHT
jgi:hypothetical protein